MNFRSCLQVTRAALAALALVAPLAANAADASIARVAEIHGSVLVGAEATIASARAEQRLVAGSRVLTTAGATAVIEYDNGCRVTVSPGERFRVAAQPPCGARFAAPHRGDRGSFHTTSVGR